MTFYEAAVAVLERAGRPLHYKKITEQAIRHRYLSHVGRTPEVTMGARLARAVEHGGDETELVSARAGVYALRAWSQSPATAETTPQAQVAPQTPEVRTADSPKRPRGRRRRRRRRARAARSDATHTASAGSSDTSSELRELSSDDGSSSATDSTASPDEGGRDAPESGDETRPFSPVDLYRDRGLVSADDSAPEKSQRARGDRSAPDVRASDADFESLASAALVTLRSENRPLPASELLRAIGGDAGGTSSAALAAALVTDNREREGRGERPRFMRYPDEGWGLTEWRINNDVLAIETHLHEAVEGLQTKAIEQLAETIEEFDVETWQHLVLALLKHMGYTVLGTRRLADDIFVVRAEHRVGLSCVYVAISLCDAETLDREAVTRLRGTLHHHDSSRGVIFTTGEVTDPAIEESRIPNLAPITLIGPLELAAMLVDAGIGVHKLAVPVVYVDQGFFERLRE